MTAATGKSLQRAGLLLAALLALMPRVAESAPSCPPASDAAQAEKSAPWHGSALHRAVLDGDRASVSRFLAAGADPNLRDNRGWTPLFATVSLTVQEPDPTPRPARTMLEQRQQEEREKTALFNLLMAAHADVKLRGPGRLTLLHQATSPASAMDSRYALPIIRRLIAAGADIDAQDDFGITALMNASLRDRADIVRSLLENGASANLVDCEDETALDLARREHAVNVILLLERAAK
jgi:ankyrin repeat protein